jgi:hypothetical protein
VGYVYLALEALDGTRVLGDLGMDRLQCDVFVKGEVLDFVYFSHPTLGDIPNHLVTIANDVAR